MPLFVLRRQAQKVTSRVGKPMPMPTPRAIISLVLSGLLLLAGWPDVLLGWVVVVELEPLAAEPVGSCLELVPVPVPSWLLLVPAESVDRVVTPGLGAGSVVCIIDVGAAVERTGEVCGSGEVEDRDVAEVR